MDDRGNGKRVGTNVSQAISSAGVSQDSIAEAIGLSSSDFQSRLERDEISVPQLFQVGGLLGVPASSLLRGIA